MYPISHKTIFVVDESPHFVGSLCNQAVEFDVSTKSRTGPPLPPSTKSLWTCAIEGIAEYCRIVWDIYSDGDRLISYVRSHSSGVVCTQKGAVLSWRPEEQSLPVLMNQLIWTSRESMVAKFTAVRKHDHGNLLNGFQDAIEAIGRPSDVQLKAMKKNGQILNRGRIVCISKFSNDAQIMALQEKLSQLIDVYNESVRAAKKADQSDQTERLPIDSLDILFLNTIPLNDTSQSSKIVNIPNHQVSPVLTSEVTSTKSGTFLSQKLTSLVLKHYNLASTTVTGIPMKEEQNASSSANYDVEIFHPEIIHTELFSVGGAAEKLRIPKDGVEYETLPLKWCTPRSTSAEIHYTTVASRVTPVDVNSRPSSCLTNFLLSGRTVMLEMPRSKGTKFMSHMLASHRGELYIHTLCSSRSVLEDPPSISEGVGGRVTDYRINDFGESIMKINKLIPCTKSPQSIPASSNVSTPLEDAVKHLDRSTIYWPIVLGHSIMYNIQGHIGPLLELIPKDKLTQEEVNECRQALFQVVSMESKGVNLNVPGLVLSKGSRGPRKDEMYKMLYKELEHFISAHCVSPEHQLLLNCLHELHSGGTTGTTSTSTIVPGGGSSTFDTLGTMSSVAGNAKTLFDTLIHFGINLRNGSLNRVTSSGMNEVTWKETPLKTASLGTSATGTSSTVPILGTTDSTNKRTCTASIQSSGLFEAPFASGTETLLSFWTKKLKYEESKSHPSDFAGRLNGSDFAPLYVHLEQKQNPGGPDPPVTALE